MDRVIVQVGAVPLTNDILNTNKDSMVGLGMAMLAVLGNQTCVDGLACTPGSGLQVSIGPGSIYTFADIDATAYGNLPPDTADSIVQQGIMFGQTPLTLTAPGTAGQSVVWLIEAQFRQVDANPVALYYYDSANPTNPLPGSATNTIRQGVCAIQAKEGTPATTGTQVAPAADSGWVPIWAVTIAHGAVSIIPGNIALAANAPFISAKLGNQTFRVYAGNPNGNVAGTQGAVGLFPDMIFDITNTIMWVCTTTGNAAGAVWTEIGESGTWPFYGGISTGSANAQVITVPDSVQSFVAGVSFWFTAGYTNTSATTITAGSFGTFPAVKDSPTGPIALVANDIVAANDVYMTFDGTSCHLAATALGTAALANATSATGTVAAVSGAFTIGHVLAASDTSGTAVDGGAVSTFSGSSTAGHIPKFNNTSGQLVDGYTPSSAQTTVVMASGIFTAGNFLVAADTSGTAKDGGGGVPILLNTLTASNSAYLESTTNFTSAYSYYEVVFENLAPHPPSGFVRDDLHIEFYVNGTLMTDVAYMNTPLGGTPVGLASSGVLVTGVDGAVSESFGFGTVGVMKVINPALNDPLATCAVQVISEFATGAGSGEDGSLQANLIWYGYSTFGSLTGFRVYFPSYNIDTGIIKIYGRA